MKGIFCFFVLLLGTATGTASANIYPGATPQAVDPDPLAKVIAQVEALGGKYHKPGTFSSWSPKPAGTIPGQPAHGFSFRGEITKEQLAGFAALKIDFPFMLDLCAKKNKDTGELLQQLTALDNLHSLRLHGALAADANLVHLAKFKNLKVLELGCTPYLTNKGLKQLADLGSLQSLGLYQCFKLTYTGSGVKYLGRLRNLQMLYVYYNGTLFAGHPRGH